MIDGVAAMSRFLLLLASEPEVAKVPFMVDSSKWEVIEAGLKCLQGKGIVNSISLKEGEAKFREQAAKVLKYGAAVVVMAFDEQGQAASRRQNSHLRTRLSHPRGRSRFPAEDIIFDPNILTVGTGIEEHNNYAVDFIEATRWIKQNLPHAKVSGGLSNVVQLPRQQSRARSDAQRVPVSRHQGRHGHGHRERRHVGGLRGDRAGTEGTGRRRFAESPSGRHRAPRDVRRKTQSSQRRHNRRRQKVEEEWRKGTIEERLSHALVKGIDTYIDADTEEARAKYGKPLAVIEGR